MKKENHRDYYVNGIGWLTKHEYKKYLKTWDKKKKPKSELDKTKDTLKQEQQKFIRLSNVITNLHKECPNDLAVNLIYETLKKIGG